MLEKFTSHVLHAADIERRKGGQIHITNGTCTSGEVLVDNIEIGPYKKTFVSEPVEPGSIIRDLHILSEPNETFEPKGDTRTNITKVTHNPK